jgi:hypothetical protein
MRAASAWGSWFPKGHGHTTIAFLKRCPEYEEAKNGDMNASLFVVSRCVKQNRILALREKYPNAVLLPVIGRNRLPLALAQAIGLPIWRHVYMVQTVSRKTLYAIQRLLHKPVFYGFIRKEWQYILVDDVITQGGTITALREFVHARGGRVVAVVALAFSIGSHAIAPDKKHLVLLMVKYGILLTVLMRGFGVVENLDALTNSQVKYLLRFSSVDNIRRKMEQAILSTPCLSNRQHNPNI